MNEQSPDGAEAIPWAKPHFWGNERQYVTEALNSTWISGGTFVDRLEEYISDYFSVPHALAVSNGTTAIHLAYLALGLGPNDEVIVPGFSFLAAANIALHCGAKPVFAEVDAATWCLSAEHVEKCLTPRTRLIVAVHTYGNVCEMDPILELAESHGIPVLEDAAEAFASKYKNRLAGTISQIGTLSFQATKTITTGEGGMVLTGNNDWAETMKLYRSHGMLQRRYWHEVAGHNFRLTNLQAALGCAQFESLGLIVEDRKRVHQQYLQLLSGEPGITLQHFATDIDPVLWAIAVKLDPEVYPQGRDGVMTQMQRAGLETRPGFYAASEMKLYNSARLLICENISQNTISLPTYPGLTDAEIARVCSHLKGLRK